MYSRNSGAFSIWSEGELVGETRLDYVANTSEVKLGDFTATEYGERFIAIRMAVRKALMTGASHQEIVTLQACRDAATLVLKAPDGHAVTTDDIEITDLEWLISLAPLEPPDESWEDDVRSSEMELREELQPDTLVLDELAELIHPSLFGADEELWSAEEEFSWESELNEPLADFPRYQIQVRISGGG